MSVITSRFTTSGALAELVAHDLSLLLYPATELEAGPCQLWLRAREGGVRAHPLTGPASGSIVDGGVAAGQWAGLDYIAWFETVGSGYCWQWRVRNASAHPVEFDVVFTQDVALTSWEDLRRNEYYVSQYLDLTPVDTGCGTALAVRQNMPDTGNPWLALASLTGVAAWATDALQLRGSQGGLDLAADLPSERLQHEHTLAALQAPAVTLQPAAEASGGFVGVFVAEHPAATGASDAAVVDAFVRAGGWSPAPDPVPGETGSDDTGPAARAVPTLFAPRDTLEVRDPTWADVDAVATGPRELTEEGPDGAVWSAFVGDTHVVGLAKERAVLRPHGHVAHWVPSPVATDDVVASTVWMDGVFCSQLTRGHASGAPGVTLRRSYLGLTQASGVRAAVWHGGSWRLLGRPSLWVQGQHACSWHYVPDGDGPRVDVTAQVAGDGVRLEVACTPAARVLVAVEEDHAGVRLASDAGGFVDDAPLYADGTPRGGRWRCLLTDAVERVGVQIGFPGQAATAGDAFAWRTPALSSDVDGLAEVNHLLDWLAHDASVHYQAPRGLEQYTGGAWGTRDVCQGPVGLLVASGEHTALRATLLAVFAGQQDDGDWPQWFDYLPSSAAPGHRSSHGDIVYWPLLALGHYLSLTGDASILDESVPFVGQTAFSPPLPLHEHLSRAVERVASRRTLDPRLPAYGHGDWNDSLQPARSELAQQMCSAWTSVLEIESLRTLRDGLLGSGSSSGSGSGSGAAGSLAARLADIADSTEDAVKEQLLVEGELAGYAILDRGQPELVVHPRDARTGLRHGSLQVIHAIAAELLDPDQARRHVAMIDAHLQGPHGIYLFDRPIPYAGGELRVFKRAEAATFWGREIGLMYTHAHLRWVEALTHLGDGERAWQEFLRVVPVGLSARVSGARPRQSTCYYSSADAAFPDRYAAVARASELFDPTTPFEGGWRVYSSGPGLALQLLTERILGIRFRAAGVEVDPVLHPAMDGLVARVPTPGEGHTQVTFRVGGAGHGVRQVLIDGREQVGKELSARYRAPGLRLPAGTVLAGSEVEVHLG
ncbi:MAG: GH36-type glycosyl hydrolase domain-containing protein [Actinomycetes bacterium]